MKLSITKEILDSLNGDTSNDKFLNSLGGVNGLASSLGVDVSVGLNEAQVVERAQLFGKNEFPVQKTKSWMELFLESFEDTTLIVLIVAAVVSLAVGIYEDPSKGWIEGAAILFAVVLVAVVTATNNYQKEAQFQKLNSIKEDITITALRNGQTVNINTKTIVVGDVIILNAGDKIPADGIFITGSDVTCDQSSLTGEPDDIPKGGKKDLFLFSGTNVSSGFCTVLITAVGNNSQWGKLRATLVTESVDTPLQEKLDTLAGQIGNGGMIAAGATFLAMVFVWYKYPEERDPQLNLFEYLLKAFIMAVTIVVVAVPEGLPLAVTLSLAYSTQKMMKDNNLIRVLAACETMGNATNICSDKTGTLTQNRMTVVEGWVAGSSHTPFPGKSDLNATFVDHLTIGASVNSTASLLKDPSGKLPTEVLGNKTEGALLLLLASNDFQVDYAVKRAEGFDAKRGDKMFTFSSERKRMSVLLVNVNKKDSLLYTKGASEVILSKCTSYLNADGKEVKIDVRMRKEIELEISKMAQKSLRTVALAHRLITGKIDPKVEAEDLENELVLDCIVGIKDPLRADVKEAVQTCQEAGILVRMVTGDNIETAKAIATECGILTPRGVCLEGPAFRRLTPKQLDDILPYLQVLARSSPTDKLLLVTRLNGNNLPTTQQEWEEAHPGKSWNTDRDLLLPGYKEEWLAGRSLSGGVGEVVGVTGDGTNDGPALKAADVGLSMGLSGTEVAKEASDIVILDDNFSSIVKAVMWGRSVFDNIRKFLQFQLTLVALTITFVSAITGFDPPLNAVMMLWVNLIMDTMGALALGTEPPSPTLLQRRPYKRDASLVSNLMLRNILVQSLFQIALLAYLLLLGSQDFDCVRESRQHITIVFNTFVFCQIFNEFNARSIGNEFNILRGVFMNPIFLVIILFTVVSQVALVEYGGEFVRTAEMTNEQWVKSILLASLTIPLGGFMRLIPVSETSADYATPSALLENNNNNNNNTATTKKIVPTSISSGVSFFVWLLLVAVIPALVFQHFEAAWADHIKVLILWLEKYNKEISFIGILSTLNALIFGVTTP